jgi:hypothetical protein
MPNEKPKHDSKAPIHRRDNSGHLDPKYAADLDARRKEANASKDNDVAFLGGKAKSKDPLAEELGENFVKSAVSGEEGLEDDLDEVTEEESGGPFVETSGGTEFADGTDASNPKGAKREPFPKT